jgi:hypothetical protein
VASNSLVLSWLLSLSDLPPLAGRSIVAGLLDAGVSNSAPGMGFGHQDEQVSSWAVG